MHHLHIKYGEVLLPIKRLAFERELQKIKMEIYISAFTNEELEKIDEICFNELGGMTYQNPDELIAQSFRNYYYGKTKSRVGNAIVNYFKKELA